MGRPVAFDFIARDRDYSRGLQRMERHTVRFGSTLGRVSGVAVRAFGGVGVAAVGAGVAAVGLGLKTEAANEQAAISFKHLLGGARQAGAFLKQLTKFAADTPFELPGVEQAAQLLLGAGESARKILPDLRAIGDAASTTTNPVDAFNRTILALSQSMNKGKLQQEEVLQVIEAGIPLWKLLSEATGTPIPKLQEMATKGQLLTKDVLPKLFDQMHKDYGGAMSDQSKTLSGRWSTFKDTISQSLAGAMVPLADMLKNVLPSAGQVFQTAVTKVSDFITGTLIPGLKTMKQWWDDNKTSVGGLASGLSTVFGPAADDATTNVGDLSKSLGGLRGILDKASLALAYLKLALLKGEEAMTLIEMGVEDVGIAVGYTINFFDRLSGGSGHAADSMVRDMRTMRDQARDKLRDIREEADKTDQAIQDIRSKHINVGATANVKLGGYTKNLYNSVVRLTGRAGGGMVRAGEVTLVGEQGPELVALPEGSFVYTTEQTRGLRGRGMAKGGWVGARAAIGRVPPMAETITRGIGTDIAKAVAAGVAQGLAGLGGAFTGGAASGNVIRLALAQARRMAASFKVALALIEAGIVESGLRNLPYGDRDSLGFLQQRPSQGWLHPMNISYAAWDFLRRAIPIQGRYGTAGMLAQAVQRSAFPARYDAVQSQALGILHAYGYDRGGLLPPGLSLAWNGTGRSEPVGRSQPTVLEIRSGGSRLDDLLVEMLRGAIRVRGGNVQLVLGR